MGIKSRLKKGHRFSVPGVFDPFSALVCENQNFDTLYLSGYGVSATLVGLPDAGFVSFSQMNDRLRSIAHVTTSSIIADGDTGFGGLANVEQAVVGYEQSGADAIQLEDQEFPKRCDHTRNRSVISKTEMVEKIRVAKESRASDDFLIIARTDSLGIEGIDNACRRGNDYIEAGADILFIEAPENESQLERICNRFDSIPLVANMVQGGVTPIFSDKCLFEMGFSIILHPTYLLGAVYGAISNAARNLKAASPEKVADLGTLNSLLGFDRIWELDERLPQKK